MIGAIPKERKLRRDYFVSPMTRDVTFVFDENIAAAISSFHLKVTCQ